MNFDPKPEHHCGLEFVKAALVLERLPEGRPAPQARVATPVQPSPLQRFL